MKGLFFLIGILLPFTVFSQIWQETFDDLEDGTTADNGATAWTITPPLSSGLFEKYSFPGFEIFAVDNTSGEGVWRSEEVNIAPYSEVAIEITLGGYWTSNTDYVRCYYRLDDGPEILFGELLGSINLQITSAASAIVSGSKVQIVIRTSENTSGSYGLYPRVMGFDDITLSSITYLYSRSSGNWNNTNTWSYDGYGGTPCFCVPGQNTHVFVGNNNNITLIADATTAGLTIANTGRVNYAANVDLSIVRGGKFEVKPDGALDRNGNNASTLSFSTYSYNTVVGGNLSVANLNIANANVTFSGAGVLDVFGDLVIASGAGKEITNNLTESLSIRGALNFQSAASGAVFVNNGNISIADRILFNSNNISFANNGSVSAINGLVVGGTNADGNVVENKGILNIGAINLNGGDFILNNTGTINQTGDFSNVTAGSSFNNLAGSIWNFSGAGANSRLFTSAAGNIFNYSRHGDQNIFASADGGYADLHLSGSGTKSPVGDLKIEGDLLISGSAQLDMTANAYSLDLAGHWTVSSANADAFVERAGTVTFSGPANQVVSNMAGAEKFSNFAIDKPMGNVILSALPATNLSVSNELTLTGGGLEINGNALYLLNPDPAAIFRTNGYIKSETTAFPYSRVVWSAGANSGAYVFPFGKSSSAADYIPFTFDIASVGSGPGTVSVATYAATTDNLPLPNGVTNLNRNGMDNRENVVDRFWQIDLVGYTTNPTADITFTATSEEVGAVSNLRAQRWNSSSWDPPIAGQVNSSLYSVTVPGVNSFSPWALSGNSFSLPVELAFFSAVANENCVMLEWKTYQEINNDYFTIEKTTDFKSFREVTTVPGNGTSKEENFYQATDCDPFQGITYYRLKQTDVDGHHEYFKPVMVELRGDMKGLKLFPNPSDGKVVTILLPEMQHSKTVALAVFNAQGEKVYSSTIYRAKAHKITFEEPLDPGIYVISIGAYHAKLAVQ